jgi:pimeloyl-ACP methyl ester carboxylesterase
MEKYEDPIRTTAQIRSAGVNIHLDVYPQEEKSSPVLIYNHGMASYCRLFVIPAMRFYRLGYTVALPDQKGNGFSGGRRGDYTVPEAVQNILDTVEWAEQNFSGPRFMMGGSLGGALTYYAAAAGAKVQAIACINLWDLSEATHAINRSVRLKLLYRLIKWTEPTLGHCRISMERFLKFEDLLDPRDLAFVDLWKNDPMIAKKVSLRHLFSQTHTPPAVPLEKNATPVIVFNQEKDKILPPHLTRKSYERLGGPKRYVELQGWGHWSLQPAFWNTIVAESHSWFQQRHL